MACCQHSWERLQGAAGHRSEVLVGYSVGRQQLEQLCAWLVAGESTPALRGQAHQDHWAVLQGGIQVLAASLLWLSTAASSLTDSSQLVAGAVGAVGLDAVRPHPAVACPRALHHPGPPLQRLRDARVQEACRSHHQPCWGVLEIGGVGPSGLLPARRAWVGSTWAALPAQPRLLLAIPLQQMVAPLAGPPTQPVRLLAQSQS